MTALGAYNSNHGSFFTLSTFDEHDKYATFGKVEKNSVLRVKTDPT